MNPASTAVTWCTPQTTRLSPNLRARSRISVARSGATSASSRPVIQPAVAKAKTKGFNVQGPYQSDTVFLRAKNGDFDAVLTMYHDQGQIAMKLMGFDRGVTLIGGFPFPICTPAHGTAYEIAGKGVANLGATRAAMLLAIRMAAEAAKQSRRNPAPQTAAASR